MTLLDGFLYGFVILVVIISLIGIIREIRK